MSAISASLSNDISNVLKTLECPISQDTFEDPVLLNCGHSLSRSSFQSLQNSNPYSTNLLPCSECRTPIRSTTPNHRLKDLARSVPKLLQELQEKLTETSLPNPPNLAERVSLVAPIFPAQGYTEGYEKGLEEGRALLGSAARRQETLTQAAKTDAYNQGLSEGRREGISANNIARNREYNRGVQDGKDLERRAHSAQFRTIMRITFFALAILSALAVLFTFIL